MLTIQNRNVNGNYAESIEMIKQIGVEEDSRNGPVLVAPYPVVTVTNKPSERVLFDPTRNANPFFHFFECLWMMHGSDDARWLDVFVSDFSSRYAEPDGSIHGAYGARWRSWFGEDQLLLVINRLLNDPNDRRVVITMWDPQRDFGAGLRDVPCNTHIYPRIVKNKYDRFLDITVCCRSNDIIWGATGANAVHFSFLQEVLAAHLGVRVGRMHQLSNNWHAYESVLAKIGEPSVADPYFSEEVAPYPVVSAAHCWFSELEGYIEGTHKGEFKNKFFSEVAAPMWEVWSLWKGGNRSIAMDECRHIAATDWRRAAVEWLGRKK